MEAIDKSVVLTDRVIDELMDDWFERDGDTFVKKRKKGRLGWEKTLKEDSPYSSYLLESPTMSDLIKRAYPLARDMIVAMDPPYKVQVKISKGRASGTDGGVVYLSTEMFDDPELSVGEKLDTFLGVTIHEGCHLLYTDLSLLKEGLLSVVKDIWNIIEDERIEELCGDLKPGLANFLEKSKYYYFDQFYLDYVVPRKKSSTLTPFDRLMSCFLYIIRYPKYLEESEIIEFGHHLLAIKKILTPYPITTKDALDAAKKIFEVFKEFYEEEERKEPKKSEGGSDGDSEGGDSSEEASARAFKKLLGDSAETHRAIKKIAGDPKVRDSKGEGTTLSDEDLSSEVSKDGGLLGDVCEGKVELGGGHDTYFYRPENNEKLYKQSVAKVKRYIPAIARIMKGHCREYKYIHRSMRSGLLDPNKLAEAYQGVPTVYLREGQVRTDKVSVCVVIDESGSMAGKRIDAARDTAILINEAIGSLPSVELFIYGHSGDQKRFSSTELYTYREKNYHPKYSLGSVIARSENRDGTAILEIAKRVRKQTKNPVLMFILSDGAPCAGGYYGRKAIEHVKQSVLQTEKLGFWVIQVCISHSYDPGEMFKNYVIMENMSTLAIELGKVIKKVTMTAAKVHVD